MFRALRHRQEVKFRHGCFASAIGAADYRNAHRLEPSDKVWSPLDYVVCEGGETDPKRDEAKRNIAVLKAQLAQQFQCQIVEEGFFDFLSRFRTIKCRDMLTGQKIRYVGGG